MHGLLLLPRMQPVTLGKHAPPLLSCSKLTQAKHSMTSNLTTLKLYYYLVIISPLKVLQRDQVYDDVFLIQSYFFLISRFEDLRK